MGYKGNNIAQGRDAAKELLKSDQALYAEIEEAVKAALEADAAGKK
jgi:recombination protein RecA